MTLRRLAFLLAMTLVIAGCGKKETAAPAPALAAKAPGSREAKPGAEPGGKTGAKADPAKQDRDPAAIVAATAKAAQQAKALDSKTRVARSMALVDQMAAKMREMNGEIDAAGSDRDKIKAISEKFRDFAESHRVQGEALSKAMSAEEKVEVATHAKKTLAPLMSRMMAKLMAAMAPGMRPAAGAPQGGSGTAGGGSGVPARAGGGDKKTGAAAPAKAGKKAEEKAREKARETTREKAK